MTRESVRRASQAGELTRLPESHWKQFHRVRCVERATGRVIDHVLVGPSGVYVIDQRIAPAAGDLVATRESARAVGALLPARYLPRVKPVVCIRDGEPMAEWREDVMVTSMPTLAHIARSSPVVLSTSEVGEVSTWLEARLERLPEEETAASRRWPRLALGGAAAAAVAATAAAVLEPGLLDAALGWLRSR